MTVIIFGFRESWRSIWCTVSVRTYWMEFRLYQSPLSFVFSICFFVLFGLDHGLYSYFILIIINDQRDRESWQPRIRTSFGSISFCHDWVCCDVSPSFFLARYASSLQGAVGVARGFLDGDWQPVQSLMLCSLFLHRLLIEYLLGLVLISWNSYALDHRCTWWLIFSCRAPVAARSYQSSLLSTIRIITQLCWSSFDFLMVATDFASILFRALLIWRSWPWFWPLLTFGCIKRFKMHFIIAIIILDCMCVWYSTTRSCAPLKLAWRRQWARRHLQRTLQLYSLINTLLLPSNSFVTRWSMSLNIYFAPQWGQVLARKSLGALSTARSSTSRLWLTMTIPTMSIMMLVACMLFFSLGLLVPLLDRPQIRLIDIQIQERFISDDFVFLTRYFWFTLF